MAARSARAHREDSARARGLHPRRFAPRAARFARAHREDSARPRGLHPRRFAPMAARCARAHREDSARARGLHPWQVAPRAARSARAHREDSTRSRRGMVLNSLRLVFSHLSGGVWRRPAPRPLRKISPPNGGSPRAPLFCGLLWGDLRGLAFSNFFLRSP